MPHSETLTRRELLFVAGAALLSTLAGMKSQAQSETGRPTVPRSLEDRP